MPALSKFLVLLALFLLASLANAFVSLSSVAGNQIQVNHLTQLLNEPSRKPTCEPTTDQMNDQTAQRMKLVALHPVNQSSQRVMYYDKGKDDGILSGLHNSSNTQTDWQGPNPIGMGQQRNFETIGLLYYNQLGRMARRGMRRK
jgi:hypothetical protein